VTASRVLLVGDDPLSLAGVAALLAPEPEVEVAAQGALDEVPGALAGAAVDVLCWDPGQDEASAGHLVRAAGDLPILALLGGRGGRGGPPGPGLLRAGVRALVARDASGPALAAALHAAAAGFAVLEAREAQAWLRAPPAAIDGPGALTPREAEVLGLLAEGRSNKAIAARLGVSEHTAKFHVNAILGKLGAATRAEAIVLAARRGLVLL
jgi:two-component system, NarL family, nitrate/nitrite response regulator NarL